MGKILSSPILFWMGWIILPIFIEIIPSIYNFGLTLKRYRETKRLSKKPFTFFPSVTIIIPVYNSAPTLEACLESVYNSTYGKQYLEVFCVDNGSKDDSFAVFTKVQAKHLDMNLNWFVSNQGKSSALNLALFNSNGKYIINIDSDGILEEHALYNMIKKFELQPDITCMTGTILTQPRLIEKTENLFLRIFRRLEFLEYCNSFLAGKNFQSETKSIFTLSGAFSAFRKDAILKSQLYNTDTICEDTQMTFQIKRNRHMNVDYCVNAIFAVDPIDDFNKFYTQRQRWQIGELQVIKMFLLNKLRNIFNAFKESEMRTLIFDHTVAFARYIWYFILVFMCIFNRSSRVIVISSIIVYVIYLVPLFLFLTSSIMFLKEFAGYGRYLKRVAFYTLFMPIYKVYEFFVRLIGIINSVNRETSWKTLTFTDEMNVINDKIHSDFSFLVKFVHFIRKILEE